MSNNNLPSNIKEIEKFAKKIKLDVKYLLGEKYVGDLNLNSVKSLSENIVFNVGGYLNLHSVESLPANIVFNVGGDLYSYSVKSLPANIVFNVGEHLYLSSIKSLPENVVFNVGGYLNLSSVESLPANYSITLGYGCEVKSSLPIVYNNIGENEIQTWQNGKYQKIDGIFCEVIKDRKNIKTCKKVGSGEIFYIVTDGIKYSHGKTIKEAKADLIYKISNRDTSRFKNLDINSVLTLSEAIECYRVITGACEFGTKSFLTSIEVKKQYSIKEIIELTQNQYGNENFKTFFDK